jgi:hypothetical protein
MFPLWLAVYGLLTRCVVGAAPDYVHLDIHVIWRHSPRLGVKLELHWSDSLSLLWIYCTALRLAVEKSKAIRHCFDLLSSPCTTFWHVETLWINCKFEKLWICYTTNRPILEFELKSIAELALMEALVSPIAVRWHSARRRQSSVHPLHGPSGTRRDQGSVEKLWKAELALREAHILRTVCRYSAALRMVISLTRLFLACILCETR